MTLRNSFRIGLLFITFGLLASCRFGAEPPEVGEIQAKPSTTIMAGGEANLIITISGAESTFEWSAQSGTLSDPTQPAVKYTAPDTSGFDTVTVKVKYDGGEIIRNITFEVVAPTPTPTQTPTETPVPSDTPIPTVTVTSTPPPPILEIFPQAGNGKEFVFINGGTIVNLFLPNENCIHSGFYGLQLTYNMSGTGNGGWGVQWSSSPAGYFDASAFNALTFWVKGSSGGEIFQIGMKDTAGKEAKLGSKDYLVTTLEWSQIIIPFSEFAGVNIASIENINLGFNRDHGSGSICIDDMALTP